MKCLTMRDIKIGQKASISREITEGALLVFAGNTGDMNPIHINEEYARNTRFGRRIAQGLFGVSLMAGLLGSELPGAGSIYVSQDIEFKYPVFIGNVITAEVEVIEKNEEKNRLTLKTTCTNQDGKVVITGTAVTMPAREK